MTQSVSSQLGKVFGNLIELYRRLSEKVPQTARFGRIEHDVPSSLKMIMRPAVSMRTFTASLGQQFYNLKGEAGALQLCSSILMSILFNLSPATLETNLKVIRSHQAARPL